MSVVAFKIYEDKAQVAFDGRCIQDGDTIAGENYIKAYKISDSLIVGITGIADSCEMFKSFVEVNKKVFEGIKSHLEAIPMFISFKNALIEQYGYNEKDIKQLGGFLIVNKQYHAVFYFDDDSLRPYPTRDITNSGAFGSTGIYTSALIDAGMSLEEAIKMSAKKYTSINDNVTVLEIER
jgi:hypothetical protein